jgi:hypothetical protein
MIVQFHSVHPMLPCPSDQWLQAQLLRLGQLLTSYPLPSNWSDFGRRKPRIQRIGEFARVKITTSICFHGDLHRKRIYSRAASCASCPRARSCQLGFTATAQFSDVTAEVHKRESTRTPSSATRSRPTRGRPPRPSPTPTSSARQKRRRPSTGPSGPPPPAPAAPQ